ncbi:hypothetical protein CYMTET_29864 [Cymbomonas tetramitiformis]|uniref:peptidylprolyl isomerase n=1 Tax=Cymbomonas tetramitiformis TaxID=36881 RepID=A0AAE0FK69_9CHLO|nr:hypothetical protein CYMTET_29864 [Cymbomonas tetramitiformis]
MADAAMSDVDSKLKIAQERKEAGNEAFRNGDAKTALRCYHEILLYVSGLDKSSSGSPVAMPTQNAQVLNPEQKEKIAALTLSHHLNLAAVYVKLGKFDKGEKSCTGALKLDEGNVKARFRRGKCRSELGDLDGAQEDLMRVAEQDPEDKNVKRELAVLKQRFKKHEAKERKQYAGMFDSASAE